MSRRQPEGYVEQPFVAVDEWVAPWDLSPEDTARVVHRLLEHLKLSVYRTNDTKHQIMELQLRPDE